MTTAERSAVFTLTRADDDDAAPDGLTLEGYAAVFGQPTRIDSWEGSFDEEIKRGAFRKTIRERTPVLQFEHGRHPLLGSLPIGRIEHLAEDDDGLFVRGRLTDNWLVEPVRDAIRDGAVDGMSFRFQVIRETWTGADGKRVQPDELQKLLWEPGERGPLLRTITEVKLLELGPVVFPAYTGTSVGVRAAQLAEGVLADHELQRQVRQALALGEPAGQAPDDPGLRREAAVALLFPGTRARVPAPRPAAEPEPAPEPARADPEPDPAPEPEAAAPAGAPPGTASRDERLRYLRRSYLARARAHR